MQNLAKQVSLDIHYTPVILMLRRTLFLNHIKYKEEQFTLLSFEQHDLALM